MFIWEGVFPISGIMKSMNSCGMVNGLLNLVNRYYLQKLEEQHTELASDDFSVNSSILAGAASLKVKTSHINMRRLCFDI